MSIICPFGSCLPHNSAFRFRSLLPDQAALAITGLLRPVLRGRAEAKAAPLLLDDSGRAVPGLPAPAAPIGMAMASGVADLPGLPAISIAGPDYDFTPPPAQAADPVARLRELMRERQQDSLRILSGWIDDKEKA